MYSKSKNLLIVILLSILAILPWIGLNSFYTKGEPREALVPQAMLETGNWILPQRYGDAFATKPPFMHWFSALVSLPSGEVTEWSARLPVALSGIGIIIMTFMFFAGRVSNRQNLIAALLLLTSFEMHRSSMEARVDMPLTFFMLCGMYLLYKRYENGMKGYSIPIVLSLSAAFLIKGPVGAVLPLGIYGLFLLYKRINFGKIFIDAATLGLFTLILPGIWYFAAYKTGGQEFIDTIYTENMARMTGAEDTGHKGPVYIHIVYLLMGFIPWGILLLLSLFNIKKAYKKEDKNILASLRDKFNNQSAIVQYTWIAAVTVILFYSIPTSKRPVYTLPSYPFFAILFAQWFSYLIDNKKKTVSIVCLFLSIIAFIAMIITLSSSWGLIDLITLGEKLRLDKETMFNLNIIQPLWEENLWYSYILISLTLIACIQVFRSFRKRNFQSMFYGAIGVMFCMNLYLDAYVLPAIKNGMSLKEFALETKSLAGNNTIYMPSYNSLRFYVINYYQHNQLKDFEKLKPVNGYMYIADFNYDEIVNTNPDYNFEIIKQTPHRYNDLRKVVYFVKFDKK